MSSLNAAQSRVRLAAISLKQAKTDYDRMKNLFDQKLVSAEEFEKADVTLKQAEEEKLAADDNLEIVKEGISKNNASLSSTFIRSTITGLILDVPVKVGNSVIMSNTFNDGTTIATVADMTNLIFKGKIDETEVGRIHEGMPVKISLGALQDVPLEAKLEYISPKGEEENGANQFEIKAAVDVPDSITIRSGYSANATIVLKSVKGVLVVPESVLEFSGDTSFVNVLTDSVPQQKFERRRVSLGMSDGISMELKQGVAEGDIVRGAAKSMGE